MSSTNATQLSREETTGRRPATLSIDLDNLWTYQRGAGISSWEQYPSFLEVAIPRIRSFLESLNCRATCFIVARDATLPGVRPCLKSLADDGHEIGNHSFDHDPEINSSTVETIEADLEKAQQAITSATGVQPKGYRAPAFSVTPPLLQALMQQGMEYDASIFPSSVDRLAQNYQRRHQNTDSAKPHYGNAASLPKQQRGFFWQHQQGSLVEWPVTTLPGLGIPVHGTYLHFLADQLPWLANLANTMAIHGYRLSKISPSFLLHASDFIGSDDGFNPGPLPGMKANAATKIARLTRWLTDYQRYFHFMPITEAVMLATEAQASDLPIIPLPAVPMPSTDAAQIK